MDLPAHFSPQRRSGLIFHFLVIVIFSIGGGFSLWYALRQQDTMEIVGWLLFSVFLLALVPFFVYRGYALAQAHYILDRDGLRLRWGLRGEDISMPAVEWIRPANELGYALRLPFLHWPGSIVGKRNTEGLGLVDFIAADRRNLLLIATPEKVYAISPSGPSVFLNTCLRAMELGSLAPLSTTSTPPTIFYKRIWSDRAARVMIFGGALTTSLLAIITSMIVANTATLSLGFDRNGQPFPPGPAEYVLLLPVLGGLIYGFDLLAGMFFYRRAETQLIAHMLWGAGIVTSFLLLTAVFILAR